MPLFRPYKFGKLKVRNRFALAPMTRSRSPKGIPGKDVANYYRRYAENEVGLIITEGVAINHKAALGYPDVPNLHDKKAIKGWKRVVDGVHKAGGAIVPQIWHVGNHHRLGDEPIPNVPGYGPSSLVENDQVVVKEMSRKDIQEVVKAFADAARQAKKIGFDGVEIHGAHGYLIDQFFWPRTNRRADRYGGSMENRLRFAVEIIRAVRRAVGPKFPVIFRFSQWKPLDYQTKLANNPEELSQFLTPLSRAGVDIFHASSRRYFEPEFEESNLNLAGWTKQITGKPVITVGSIGLDSVSWRAANPAGIEALARMLLRDEFDLAAVGRALLADSQWVKKIREDRFEEIKPFTKDAFNSLEN
ncbi:MAG: NADH:flavin oxidoreductase [Magnetococcales bacterium]|nr:NADH:flavin oxidoreductase [Magnetococcales bacterium]NGZ25538.1 NADH:flavin oxidoreductase [Magnetococcales bacterium]